MTRVLKTTSIPYLFASLTLTLLLLTNLKAAYEGCFNGYDFGIYQQAIYDINWSNLNPYVTVRGINILNDHFDPVIYLASLFTSLAGKSPYSLIIFEWLTILAALMLAYLLYQRLPGAPDRQDTDNKFALFVLLFALSKGVHSGLSYPIHASFWSVGVFVYLVYAVRAESLKHLLAASILLCLFKESYPFCIFMLAIYFLVMQRRWRVGLSLLGLSLVFMWFVFYGRTLLFGQIHGHGHSIISNLLSNPILTLVQATKHTNLESFLKALAPGVTLMAFIFMSKESVDKKTAWASLFILIPLFAIQFLFGSWEFQYIFPFFVVPLAAFLYSTRPAPGGNYKRALVILFLASSITSFTQAFEFIAFGTGKNCKPSFERREDLAMVKSIVDKLPNKATIMSTGGAIVNILSAERRVFHLKSHGDILDQYDYLLLEKNESGDTYPLIQAEVDKIRNLCITEAHHIEYEGQTLVFAKGPFASQCWKRLNSSVTNI